MIKHHQYNIVLKDHPIVKRIGEYFARLDIDGLSNTILSQHVRFVYPRMICFSFRACPDNYDFIDLSSSYFSDNTNIMMNDGEQNKIIEVPDKNKILAFFPNLLRAISETYMNPIMVLDLRMIGLLDMTLFAEIIKLIRSSTQYRILVIVEQETRSKFPMSDRNYDLVISKDIGAYIKRLTDNQSNILELTLDDNLSVTTLESLINKSCFYENLHSKFVIRLNFINVSKLSFYALNLINILVHSIAHQYGVIVDVDVRNTNTKLIELLHEYRTFEINNRFLLRHDSQHVQKTPNVRQFGVILFDRSTYRSAANLFGVFLLSLRDMFKDYMDEAPSISYVYEGQSYKAKKYRALTRYNIVGNIVNELVENAARHSEGVGYLSALISNYRLHLFVGDCGLGLALGILKNYKMENEIHTDVEAIKYAFNLTVYTSKRKLGEKYDLGAGQGLADTLRNIFTCQGKFIFRTGSQVGAFMNPVSKTFVAPRIICSKMDLIGTQYMIVIPLNANADMPRTTDDFFGLMD